MGKNRPGPGDGLDWDAALSRVGGDVELLKDIARVFLDDCPRALTELREAGTRGDSHVTERVAHGLKGAASNFGAKHVVDASYLIEVMGREGKLNGFDAAFSTLETALAALGAELEALLVS
jgi:two-component system sensor histidine kinase/response regulator